MKPILPAILSVAQLASPGSSQEPWLQMWEDLQPGACEDVGSGWLEQH